MLIGSGLRWIIDGLKLLATTKIGSVPSSFDNSFTSRANQILFLKSGVGVKKSTSLGQCKFPVMLRLLLKLYQVQIHGV